MNDRSIDLTAFTKLKNVVVAKNEDSWKDYWTRHPRIYKDYKPEEIEDIINSSGLAAQQKLSRYFFERNGLYKKIIMYYASLLNYSGLLIPNPSFGKQLSSPFIQKKYFAALEFLEKANLVELMTRMSLRALIDGSYYGIIQSLDKDGLILFDLPS